LGNKLWTVPMEIDFRP